MNPVFLSLLVAAASALTSNEAKSSRVTFTLGQHQTRCFKEDLIEGQILDIYFELFGKINYEEEPESIMSSRYGSKLPIGIYLTVFDPEGAQIETVVVASAGKDDPHQHRSYHHSAKVAGTHRICLNVNKALFVGNSSLKYECSISIDSLFEKMFEEKEASGVVTKEHFDRVDATINSLENKAGAIITDQAYQRDRQKWHQDEQQAFSSSFTLYVSIQIVFLIATVLWQVLTLRNFFI